MTEIALSTTESDYIALSQSMRDMTPLMELSRYLKGGVTLIQERFIFWIRLVLSRINRDGTWSSLEVSMIFLGVSITYLGASITCLGVS